MSEPQYPETASLSLPDSLGETMPSPFQEKLDEYYHGKLGPYCHVADDIRQRAEQTIANAVVIKFGAVQVWRSRSTYRSELLGADVNYALVAEKNGSHLRGDRRAATRRIISLVINDQLSLPAALILPRTPERPSASVVVGDEVNDPSHLKEIGGIISYLWNRGARFGD